MGVAPARPGRTGPSGPPAGLCPFPSRRIGGMNHDREDPSAVPPDRVRIHSDCRSVRSVPCIRAGTGSDSRGRSAARRDPGRGARNPDHSAPANDPGDCTACEARRNAADPDASGPWQALDRPGARPSSGIGKGADAAIHSRASSRDPKAGPDPTTAGSDPQKRARRSHPIPATGKVYRTDLTAIAGPAGFTLAAGRAGSYCQTQSAGTGARHSDDPDENHH